MVAIEDKFDFKTCHDILVIDDSGNRSTSAITGLLTWWCLIFDLGLNVSKYREGAQRLTERVYESSGSFLVATFGFTASVNNRHAVLGRCWRWHRGPLVFWVTAGAVIATGGWEAIGVRRAVTTAELVHDSSFCHQFYACKHKKSTRKLWNTKPWNKNQRASSGNAPLILIKWDIPPVSTSLNVIHGGIWRGLLFGRGTLGNGEGLVVDVAAAAAITLHLLAKATGLLLHPRVDLTATFSSANEQRKIIKSKNLKIGPRNHNTKALQDFILNHQRKFFHQCECTIWYFTPNPIHLNRNIEAYN